MYDGGGDDGNDVGGGSIESLCRAAVDWLSDSHRHCRRFCLDACAIGYIEWSSTGSFNAEIIVAACTGWLVTGCPADEIWMPTASDIPLFEVTYENLPYENWSVRNLSVIIGQHLRRLFRFFINTIDPEQAPIEFREISRPGEGTSGVYHRKRALPQGPKILFSYPGETYCLFIHSLVVIGDC